MLTIITVTKDDLAGVTRTIKSTEKLRLSTQISQIIIDSSNLKNHQKLKQSIEDKTNIVIYYQAPQGIVKAFNYGIDLASDGWLWFLNGGDEIHPDFDLDLFDKILSKTQAQVVIFEVQYDTGEITKHPCLPNLWPPIANWIPHPGTLIRKDILSAQQGFDEKFIITMDGELWIRLLNQNYTVDLVSIPIVKFYQGGISSNISETAKEAKSIIKKHYKLLLKIWIKSGLKIIKTFYLYHQISKKSNNK
jgi:glycosyltransferase involved in cell wall biosynthesis